MELNGSPNDSQLISIYRVCQNKTKSLPDAIIKSVLQCSCSACLQTLIAKPCVQIPFRYVLCYFRPPSFSIQEIGSKWSLNWFLEEWALKAQICLMLYFPLFKRVFKYQKPYHPCNKDSSI